MVLQGDAAGVGDFGGGGVRRVKFLSWIADVFSRVASAALSKVDGWASRATPRILAFAEHRIALLAGILLIVVIVLWVAAPEQSDAIRNFGLVIAAIVALPIAIWRSRVAEQSVLNERYQRSVEMLGSSVLSVRLGGIYVLERLAWRHPEHYHVEVMKVLFAFIRQPIEDENAVDRTTSESTGVRVDVQGALDVVRTCRAENHAVEVNSSFSVDLRGAMLKGADLSNIDLSGTIATDPLIILLISFEEDRLSPNLSHADLSGADLEQVDITDGFFNFTNLSGADLRSAKLWLAMFDTSDLRNANLGEADLAHSRFLHATLSWRQLPGSELVPS